MTDRTSMPPLVSATSETKTGMSGHNCIRIRNIILSGIAMTRFQFVAACTLMSMIMETRAGVIT